MRADFALDFDVERLFRISTRLIGVDITNRHDEFVEITAYGERVDNRMFSAVCQGPCSRPAHGPPDHLSTVTPSKALFDFSTSGSGCGMNWP